ncbi:PIG-L deacetylase family protein [Streptomyces californicus]|uniref:PIG-L deacetylase family protein n=1 Tax=Streptomyces californicus TaxID=67351 RepID=UPI00296F5EF2|nr:PIG-L family deacetylase [Streptomyces californicus]MDW4918839.1 PIG-L family deacetylase [Streptomyces californicus]
MPHTSSGRTGTRAIPGHALCSRCFRASGRRVAARRRGPRPARRRARTHGRGHHDLGRTSPRATELADALAVLGAGAPRMLGYGDARNPRAAPGSPRLLDVPLDDVVGAVVQQIRDVRLDIVITHDALGQLTGHPDHRRTHQVTLLAVQDAAPPHLHPLVNPGRFTPSTAPPTPTPALPTSGRSWPASASSYSRFPTLSPPRPSTSHRGCRRKRWP